MLDPFPWGGGVTTLDAFAVGTPVVTAPSLQTVVELASGMYRKMGVDEFIAHNETHYISLAVELGTNATRRALASELLVSQHHAVYDDSTAVPQWTEFMRRAARSSAPGA